MYLEPVYGEAWNNLPALWLRKGPWKEALKAAEQAVKHKEETGKLGECGSSFYQSSMVSNCLSQLACGMMN